jgi:hypothetical protein
MWYMFNGGSSRFLFYSHIYLSKWVFFRKSILLICHFWAWKSFLVKSWLSDTCHHHLCFVYCFVSRIAGTLFPGLSLPFSTWPDGSIPSSQLTEHHGIANVAATCCFIGAIPKRCYSFIHSLEPSALLDLGILIIVDNTHRSVPGHFFQKDPGWPTFHSKRSVWAKFFNLDALSDVNKGWTPHSAPLCGPQILHRKINNYAS